MSIPISEPIEAVITRFHAPSQKRRGDNSNRLWWVCPFHDDHNPSLFVKPGERYFHCFSCGTHGDAIDFVQKLKSGLSFAEAVRAIGGQSPDRPGRERPVPKPLPLPPPTARPEGWQEFARGLVEKAESLLWSDSGCQARSYLGQRGLKEETIRLARLGYWPEDQWISKVFPKENVWVPRGIVLPWLDGPEVVLINVRRPEGDPKYTAVKGSRREGLYPGRAGIVMGKPVVIVEGEFDALLLGQETGDLAPVVTFGSAGKQPRPRDLSAMLRASAWIIAGDADSAGERSAEDWIARSERCIRLPPPRGKGKDWGDAYQNGLDLRGYFTLALREMARKSGPPPEPVIWEPAPPPEIYDYDDLVEDKIDFGSFKPVKSRWRCQGRYCLKKGPWWMSKQGDIQCMNCRPPSFPWLVAAEGDASDAPFVELE